MNREGKKCILYPRVSTEMQVEGYSLDGQKNSLKRFAEREEMQKVEEKIFGFFVYISKIFIDRIHETTNF